MPASRNATKLQRLSAGTLLNAKDYTQVRLRRAVRETVDEAASDIARHQRNESHRAVALVAIGTLAQRMASKSQAAIVEGRLNARREGSRRAFAELAAAGLVLPHGAQPSVAHLEDEAYAASAAESLASAWRSLAITTAGASLRRGKDAAVDVRKASQMLRPRVDMTATTESARAYNDGHRLALVHAAEGDRDVRRAVELARVAREWSALIEACPVCRSHDGERVPYDETFSGGDEPGEVHPHCMCTSVLIVEG